MKIITLSGEDTMKSYERLQKFIDEAKKRKWEILHFIDSKANIFESLSIRGLFEEKRLFIVHDPGLITKKDFEKIISYKDDFLTLVFYYDHDLTPTLKKKLKDVGKVEEFPLPKIIWNFLDSFYPGNSEKCLILFQELVKTTPFEVIMVLLIRHLRDQVWVQTDTPPKYPSWRISKLKSQAKRFSSGSLENIVEDLAKIDYQSKVGQVDPIIGLDFLIVEKLQ